MTFEIISLLQGMRVNLSGKMTNVLNNSAEIVLCAYAIVKHVFGRKVDRENNNSSIYELLQLGISLAICIATILLVLPFVILRNLINIYLEIHIGSKYNGLLEGMDAVWTSDIREAKHIINSIVFIQIDSSSQEFLSFLRQKIKNTKDRRFNSTLHTMLGYYYRIHSDDVVNNAIQLIKLTPGEASSKRKFQERVSDLANKPLSECSSYEVWISDEPVKFYGTQSKDSKIHVIIIRAHHSVGDGPSLVNYLLEIADKDSNITLVKESPKHQENKMGDLSKKQAFTSERCFSNYVENALNVMKSTSTYCFTLLAPHDDNILHGPTLSGEKLLVYHIDDEKEYVSKIKSIKSQYGDCKFSDVIYTAISASLLEYFAQHTEHIPSDINMSFVSRIKGSFAALTVKIPVNINGVTSPVENLAQRLQMIKVRHKRVYKSIDSLIFYWLSQIIAFLPVFLTRRLCNLSMKTTITFSNVPGTESLKFGGHTVKDMVFWTPNVYKTGVGFSAFTYGGRLQFGLIVDKALIHHPDEALLVLKNVYKYIDLLAMKLGTK